MNSRKRILHDINILTLLCLVISCGCSPTGQSSDKNLMNNDSPLVHLGSSERISSNHYSDVVLDSKGNAYIASFYSASDNNDYIKIIQVKPNGEIGWAIGEQTVGRATAISINNKDELWVSGYFSNTFTCGNKVLTSTGPENMFIIKLNTLGICSWSFVSAYGSKAFDINVNTNGELLVAGVLDDKERFDEIEVIKDLNETQYLAKFNSDGRCAWVKQFNGSVRRIKSDYKGRFYVCGSYSNRLFKNEGANETTSSYDHDGFLFQVSDTINWIWNFGNPGVIKYGYRTYDVAADMDIDEGGRVWVIATQENRNVVDSTASSIEGLVYSFDSIGVLQHHFKAGTNLQRGAVSTICLTKAFVTVTGTQLSDAKTEQNSKGFIKTFGLDGTLVNEKDVTYTESGMIRSAYSNKTGSVFSGHFRGTLTIDTVSIENTVGHGLFRYQN